MIEEIKAILDSNQNITDEVKNDLLELVNIFTDTFKNVNLDNLKERLKTLKIKRESMYLAKLPCEYKAFDNEIIINVPRFESCDARHWLMHSLLGVITGKDNYYGFNDADDSLVALNEGFTEIITNNLVGDVDNNFFTYEMVMTNLIGKVIGEDLLFETYFGNNPEKLLKAMVDANEKLTGLNELLNRDYKDNYSGGEYTTNILDRQCLFAEMFRNLISEVRLNGISSPAVCPNLESYNTGVPSEDDFVHYNSRLAEQLREFEATNVGPEVLDVNGNDRTR